MQLLLDTNVILDVLLHRQPWFDDSKKVWQAVDDGEIKGYIIASTLTDIFYVVRKVSNLTVAYVAVQTCLDAFEICSVDRTTLELALSFSGSDFEDNLQMAGAVLNNLQYIVTRDKAGFISSPVPSATPIDILQHLIP